MAATGFRPQTKPGTGTFSTAVLTRLRPCFLFLRMFACPSRSSSCWRRQRLDPAHHASEQPARQMALRQHQPIIPAVFHQPSARLHEPLPQAGQRPLLDPLRQHHLLRPHLHQPAGARRAQPRPRRDRLAAHGGKGRGRPWHAPGGGWSTRVNPEAVRRAHNPLALSWRCNPRCSGRRPPGGCRRPGAG